MSTDNAPRVVKRIRGKKLPSNTKYVGRGSKLGNEYRIPPYTREQSINLYEKWLLNEIAKDPEFLSEYHGVNVACWCHEWDGQGENPRCCHADIVLEKAREKAPL